MISRAKALRGGRSMHDIVAQPEGKIRFRQGNHNEFYRVVRRRVRAYFDSTGKSRFADASIGVKASLYGGLVVVSYGSLLFGGFGPKVSLLLAIAFGVSA